MDAAQRPRRPLRRKLLIACLAGLGTLGVIEAGMRVHYSSRIGRNVLFYGTPFHRQEISTKEQVNLHRHRRQVGSYTKYFPRQELHDYDRQTGELFDVAINNFGFRGKQWPRRKQRGVVRVVTLGASSTFGYASRDHETYPVLLEAALEELDPHGRNFEVLNLGIPHLTSPQIAELFRVDGLPLKPDVVTFYEGVNDACSGSSEVVSAARADLLRVNRSIPRRLIDLTKGRLVLGAWLASRFPLKVMNFGPADIQQHAEAVSTTFFDSLSSIQAACEEVGAVFLPISQQSKSLLVPPESMGEILYAEEVELVRDELVRNGEVDARAFYFLVHAQLMEQLQTWSAEQGLPVIDGLAALDKARDVLVSWVHLSPRGNRLLAREIAGRLLEHIPSKLGR